MSEAGDRRKHRSLLTDAIHGGETRPRAGHSITTPIYQTATYVFRDTAELVDYMSGGAEREEYGRYGNPTQRVAEAKCAALEGAEAGLGFAVAWDKPGGFIGRDALLRQRAAGVKKRLAVFTLDDPEPVLWGSEPILRDGVMVGYTTSGSYGHTVGRAVGMGYVREARGVTDAFLKAGRYEVLVNGIRRPATLHLRCPVDPDRRKILA